MVVAKNHYNVLCEGALFMGGWSVGWLSRGDIQVNQSSSKDGETNKGCKIDLVVAKNYYNVFYAQPLAPNGQLMHPQDQKCFTKLVFMRLYSKYKCILLYLLINQHW